MSSSLVFSGVHVLLLLHGHVETLRLGLYLVTYHRPIKRHEHDIAIEEARSRADTISNRAKRREYSPREVEYARRKLRDQGYEIP